MAVKPRDHFSWSPLNVGHEEIVLPATQNMKIASWKLRKRALATFCAGVPHRMCRRSPADHPGRSHGTVVAASEDTVAPAKSLWVANELPVGALSRLHLSEEPDPAVNSTFKLGTVAQASSTFRLASLFLFY